MFMKKAKIFIYCIPQLNESSYILYYMEALELLGYEVHSLFNKDVLNNLGELYKNMDYWKSFDYIFFSGFSGMNYLQYQGQNNFFPIEAGVRFGYLCFDNMCRYGNSLKYLKDSNPDFFVCDSKEVEEMKEFGFKNSYFTPTCFSPNISKPGPVNQDLNYNVVFPGTFIAPESIYDKQRGPMAGLNIFEQKMIDEFHAIRSRGRYYDYHRFLVDRGVMPEHSEYNKMAMALILIQKYLLRIELFKSVVETGEDIHIFGSGDARPKSPKVIMHPNLDQLRELPDLYRSAKIITSIELHPNSSHQRFAESAGCKGFFLGEGKPDENYCFENIVQWNNLEDLKEKIKYYLANEDERLKIAQLCHDEAMSRHTNVIRMQEILNIIGI